MNDLNTHIERIKMNLKEYSDVPEWDRILIIEDEYIKHGDRTEIQKDLLITPENYNQKFDELLSEGYGWINLVINGIINKALILSVEIPAATSDVPPSKVSVNLSGPYSDKDGTLRWDISEKVNLV